VDILFHFAPSLQPRLLSNGFIADSKNATTTIISHNKFEVRLERGLYAHDYGQIAEAFVGRLQGAVTLPVRIETTIESILQNGKHT
jgi:hypothetical protein